MLTLSPSFDTTYIYFHQYNYPAFLSIFLRFVDGQSYRAQPISCLDDLI